MGLIPLLFSFKGRINRAQYWLGTVSINLINWMVMFAMAGASVVPSADKNPGAALAAATSQLALVAPMSLAMAWIALALQWKRFHDRGQSGWWSMLPMAPILFMVGDFFTAVAAQWPVERLLAAWGMPLLALVVISIGLFINLGCMSGAEGDNKYGPPPGRGAGSLAFAPAGGDAAVAASSSLFGAQSAIDRAAAEHARAAVAPKPKAAAAPMRAGMPATAPAGFGRKPAR